MKVKFFSDRISQLDPKKDHREIAFLLTCHCFPWDMERALEFALFRTFAVPSISKILVGTGEFTSRTRKRYDDTELILYEILEHGMDSLRGGKAIDRMNDMHGRFKIPNEDFLYVLSTFIFEPIRWMDRFGWRPFTELEKEAILTNYTLLGQKMHITGIPETLEDFEAFNLKYEKVHFRFDRHNQIIGNKTIELLLGFYIPRFLFPLGKPLLYSLMDRPLQNAMGFKSPPKIISALMSSLLKTRAWFIGFLPERKNPKLGTKRKRATYPNGYQIESLGTFPPRQNHST